MKGKAYIEWNLSNMFYPVGPASKENRDAHNEISSFYLSELHYDIRVGGFVAPTGTPTAGTSTGARAGTRTGGRIGIRTG
ncbi:MAG: hypothetical protein ABSE08_20060 [Syntrophobacteraceae bacterium]|jgi:hypothetical protein